MIFREKLCAGVSLIHYFQSKDRDIDNVDNGNSSAPLALKHNTYKNRGPALDLYNPDVTKVPLVFN